MKQKIIFITIVLIIILVYILFIPQMIKDDNIEKEHSEIVKKSFPNLESNIKLGIDGTINQIKLGTGIYNKGSIYITLKNEQKFSIGGSTRNNSYSPSNIMEFVQVGDSIYKKNNDDILLIVRNGTNYYFKIGQIIKLK